MKEGKMLWRDRTLSLKHVLDPVLPCIFVIRGYHELCYVIRDKDDVIEYETMKLVPQKGVLWPNMLRDGIDDGPFENLCGGVPLEPKM